MLAHAEADEQHGADPYVLRHRPRSLVCLPVAAAESQPSSLERDAARAKARARIEEAAKAIGAGEDFAAVADRFSAGSGNPGGGNWPLMPAGSFRQAPHGAQSAFMPSPSRHSPLFCPTSVSIHNDSQMIE